MDLRQALKEQYHGGMAMFAHCIAQCPDDLWAARNESNGWDRPFWKIAFHNAYFTHLYLGQGVDAFAPPPPSTIIGGSAEYRKMWTPPFEVEPYELPADVSPCSQSDLMEYVEYIDGIVDMTVNGLDLDSPDSGFPWYEDFGKLSHELMNLRHLQGHVGQLSELLMLRGIDIKWAGQAESFQRFLK